MTSLPIETDLFFHEISSQPHLTLHELAITPGFC